MALVSAVGKLIMFTGRVGEIDLGRGLATFSINSHLELLNLQLPRNLFQPGCVNSLYDNSCGVNRATYQVGTTVSGWSSSFGGVISTTHAGEIPGWWDQGSITFTSGQNAGFSRTIKSSSTNQVNLTNIQTLSPFPFAPQIGDAFTLLPGCDKTLGPGGCPKYNNVNRFRGFPFIPVPETAV